MLALQSEENKVPDVLVDLRHILHWTLCLIPSVIFSSVGVFINAILIGNALPSDSRTLPVLKFGFAIVSFVLTVLTLYRGFQLPWVIVIMSALEMLLFCGVLMAIQVSQGFPWSPLTSIAMMSATHGVTAWSNILFTQILHGISIRTLRTHLIAIIVGWCSGVAMFAIALYGLITEADHPWYIEWLITGFAYPVVSVLAGRILVADLISFALLWAFPEGSCTSVLSFFSLLVKISFYLAGQVSMLELQSWTAFGLSVVVATLSEVVGTYANALMAQFVRRKAEGYKIDAESQDFIHQWAAVRAAVSDEKLILHTHDESIGEKVVLGAAIVASLLDTSMPTFTVIVRGSVLAVAEVAQDLMQRRVLAHAANLTVTTIPPRILRARENFNITCFIIMTFNLYSFSKSLIAI
ncbi:Hypothetical Protein FCC1311_087762 [Hondaea fermentalgiana]|uniref:Uncharacterized protein n=1 Tax=Hondaea fermentalgiana TaxID=2315210 RepID=A0A2R5GNT3_9STRA|nr:Hypothetical Protein FCC1311_087762 [Hondaea fermentalgiana]|eukprot:GBG32552.1 Hypothetical Protein FCC1311_087762 [Hondaea fermentalgiana]